MSRALLALVALAAAAPLAAQGAGGAEVLGEVLAAEDARRYDEPLLRRALGEADSAVKQATLRSVGRLRDPRGLAVLRSVLAEGDTTLEATTMFSMGLIGDTAAVRHLIQYYRDRPVLSRAGSLELITALARLGGPEAAAFLRDVLESGRETNAEVLERAALEAWRLGPRAPTGALVPLLGDSRDGPRAAAAYSLSRLRVKAAAPRFLEALQDKNGWVRLAAARVLTRAYADSAGLPAEQISGLLARAATDGDPNVRIQALRSLATYRNPETASRVLALLEDPVLNVQVQAAQSLGEIGGASAVEELARIAAGDKGSWARRSEALLALARADSARFIAVQAGWATSRDWRARAIAVRGWARVRPSAVEPFLDDPDPKVVAAALEAWGNAVDGPDPGYVRASAAHLSDADAAVRSVAAGGVARAGNAADIPRLVAAYRQAARDSFPDAALAALAGITSILAATPGTATTLEEGAINGLPTPSDYVIKRWAEENWPALAARWGPAWPIATGRTLEEYRAVARTLVLGEPMERYPVVRLTMEQLGSMELRLFGPEAPLTVANFLRLVDRRYFDGIRFHRVVPGFVVQAGDPRGDGWGGPGTAIRDEINRRRYAAHMVGMALSGPDTGGSQWFITLAPQPHLDGGYTVFGEVTNGVSTLQRITQGDLIRSIRR